MSVTRADIEERWNNRIIGHYDNDDGSGVLSYLSKYGKNISDEKLLAYADYARSIGKEEMAKGFEMNTRKGLFKCLGYHLPFDLKDDFCNMVYIDNNNGNRDCFDLFEEESKNLSVYVVNLMLAFKSFSKRVMPTLKNIGKFDRVCVLEYHDCRSDMFVYISDDFEALKKIRESYIFSVSDFYVIKGVKRNSAFLLKEYNYLFCKEKSESFGKKDFADGVFTK